ncbi:hypothetical protein H6G00_07390 [Leptolyngbya sp. FACHB-541]|nr:hypothetical protein [Leptolyngbya sp. FACHB-541]MBD1996439.1 hypothetical protein [Leptolyngbya sp. FACHB-541]
MGALFQRAIARCIAARLDFLERISTDLNLLTLLLAAKLHCDRKDPTDLA